MAAVVISNHGRRDAKSDTGGALEIIPLPNSNPECLMISTQEYHQLKKRCFNEQDVTKGYKKGPVILSALRLKELDIKMCIKIQNLIRDFNLGVSLADMIMQSFLIYC